MCERKVGWKARHEFSIWFKNVWDLIVSPNVEPLRSWLSWLAVCLNWIVSPWDNSEGKRRKKSIKFSSLSFLAMQQKGIEKVFGRSEYGSGLLLSTDSMNDAMNLNRRTSYDSSKWNVAGEPDLHKITIRRFQRWTKTCKSKSRDLTKLRASTVIALDSRLNRCNYRCDAINRQCTYHGISKENCKSVNAQCLKSIFAIFTHSLHLTSYLCNLFSL